MPLDGSGADAEFAGHGGADAVFNLAEIGLLF